VQADAVISWILPIFGVRSPDGRELHHRIREIYDDTGDTEGAISMGIARRQLPRRAGRARVRLALPGPGPDIKQFDRPRGRILIDATLIRSALVPSIMRPWARRRWFPPVSRGSCS
jgi:hypothetical protein